jgi:hypothetical protein
MMMNNNLKHNFQIVQSSSQTPMSKRIEMITKVMRMVPEAKA